MRLIADGVVDREGVAGLAGRLGYEQRQVRRLITAELGAGPLAIARAQRAQTARVLTETTTLPLSELAFAAGFTSIRQFNDTMRAVFAVTPTDLRDRAARGGAGVGSRGKAMGSGGKAQPRQARRVLKLAGPMSDPAAPGLIRLRLPYRAPVDLDRMVGFLAARAIPGVESVEDGWYRRTLLLPNGTGVMSVGSPGGEAGYIDCELQLEDLRDLTAAVQRCRRLLDLDADPETVSASLAASETVLAPLVLARPGRRVPGHVDGNELALRAVLGQQVSVAAARRLGTRLVAAYGKPLERPEGTLTHCFPTAETLAAADPATLPMPRARAAALTGLAAALASGDLSLDPGAERDRAEAQLLALPGIGPWTTAYIRMRALSDPDAFLSSDAGVLEALGRLGAVPAGGRGPAARARAWLRGGAGLQLAAVAFVRCATSVGLFGGESVMTSPFVAPDLDVPRLSHIVGSPIGRLLLTGDGHALTGLWMLDAPDPSGRHPARASGLTLSPAAFTEVAAQLEEYFAGDRKEFTVPLAPSGTPFQLAVWTQLTKIPYGSTASYGDIARALGKRPVAARAVGLANGANPISVIVPCHRVIGSDGSLTGYGGGLDRKELLLRLEGTGPVTLW